VNPKKAVLETEEKCHVRIVHLDRVDRAREKAISDHEADRLALTFKVLGDMTRLKIVMALGEGEMCVCDLSAFLGVSTWPLLRSAATVRCSTTLWMMSMWQVFSILAWSTCESDGLEV